MKDTKKEIEKRIDELEKAYAKLGAERFKLKLNTDIKSEDEIFMLYIRTMNRIANYIDELKEEVEKIPW